MIATVAAVLGGALVLAVWLSILRTVFIPRERSTLIAQATLRIVAGAYLAIGRRLRPGPQQRLLDQCAPVSLFATAAVWLAGLAAGFALLAAGGLGVPVTARALGGFFLLRSARPGLAVTGWLSGGFVLAAFTTQLVRVSDAYGRRERLVAEFAATAAHPPDAEVILAEYLRTGSRDHLDSMFAQWAGWLAEVQTTHLGYPGLTHCRPAGRLCWAKAALIVLDCAALTQACAPEWAPPHTRPLLHVGSRCLQHIAAQLRIRLPLVPVSHHGREERSFADTVRLAVKAGLRPERDEEAACAAFQELRVSYAPYAIAIGQRLLYPHDHD